MNEDPLSFKKLQEFSQIADDDYVYRLVGVNVHRGTADHGHYYSLINTKRGADEPRPEVDEALWRKTEADTWKAFDDDTVRGFNFAANLKNEAFGGGQDTAKTSDAMTDAELSAFLSAGTETYGQSAYMLVYERKTKRNLREYSLDPADEGASKEINFREVELAMPAWIADLASADNKRFLVDSQLFHAHFFDMLKHVFKTISGEMVMTSHQYPHAYQPHFRKLKAAALTVAGTTLHDMLSYFDRNIQMSDITNSVGTILTFSDSGYAVKRGDTSIVNEYVKSTYIADSCQHLFKVMFTCSDAASRQHMGKHTSHAISRLFRLYGECDLEARALEHVKDIHTTLETFMDLCLVALQDKDCLKNWAKLESYFKMLLDIGSSCTTAAQFLLERSDIISDLIDFVLGNKSPRAQNLADKRTAMGGSVPPPF